MRLEQNLARELRAARKTGREAVSHFTAGLCEALETKQLLPAEFSVRALFENLVDGGREMVDSWNPRNSVNGMDVAALEAAGVVDTSAFSTINRQLLITRVLDAWNNPDLLWSKLVTVIPTTLNGERLPGITVPADEIETVPEGEDYGSTGLAEIFIDTPVIPKKGTMLKITREAIFHDRTGVLLMRADGLGEAMALNLEKRVLDLVFGIVNNYRRNGAAAIDTYQTTSPFINIKASNGLKDYTNLDAAMQLFEDMTDPDTGEPIMVNFDTLIVPTALKTAAQRITTASQVRVASGAAFAADPTDQAEIQTYSASPVTSPVTVLSSPYVKARSSSSTTWFLGEPKKAFALMENWPIQVIQAPQNSEAEFQRDVVAQYRVSHKATPAVLEPRRMTKNTA